MAAGSATQWKTAPRVVAAKTMIQSVDRRAPQVPSSLSISAVSTTSISVTWGASRDNVGVAGYGVYLNGTRLASTTARSYTLSALKCGTTYKVGVDAFDAARNRSGIASVLAATAPCVDATAPTAPASLHQSGWSQTGLAVEWSESSDNVGVAGYGIYRNGVPIAVTQQQLRLGRGARLRRGLLDLGRCLRRSREPLAACDRGREHHGMCRHQPA